MFIACVIHNEVKAAAYAVFMAEVCKPSQVAYISKFGLYLAEIGYRIAAVTVLLRAFEQRHEMYVINAAFIEIIYFLCNAFKVVSKVIDIEHHANDIISAVPVRVFFTLAVKLL